MEPKSSRGAFVLQGTQKRNVSGLFSDSSVSDELTFQANLQRAKGKELFLCPYPTFS